MVTVSEHLQRHKRRRNSRSLQFKQIFPASFPLPPPPQDADTATTCSSMLLDDTFSERSCLGRSVNSYCPENSVTCFDLAEAELDNLDLNRSNHGGRVCSAVVVQHPDDRCAIPIICEDEDGDSYKTPNKRPSTTPLGASLETFSKNLQFLAKTAMLQSPNDDKTLDGKVEDEFGTFVGQDWAPPIELEEEKVDPLTDFIQARAQTFARNWHTLGSLFTGN